MQTDKRQSIPAHETPVTAGRWRALAQATGQIIWTADAAGNSRDDAAWRAFTGQPLAATRAAGWRAAVHPDDRERLAQLWAQACANGNAYEADYRLQRAAGGYGAIHERAVPVTDDAGHITEWIGACTEVASVPTMTVDLTATDVAFRAMIEQAFATIPLGFAFHDMHAHVLAANPAAQTILGLTLAQMQGVVALDPAWHAIHEDGTPFPCTDFPAAMVKKTRQPVIGVIMGIFHPDTTAYRWISVNAVPQLRPGEAQPYRIFVTFEDITRLQVERRQLERETTQQASQLTAIFATMTDAVVIYGCEGQIVHMNDAASQMYACEHDHSFQAMSAKERAIRLRARNDQDNKLPVGDTAIARLLRGETITNAQAIEMKITALDGQEKFLSVCGTPLHDDNNVIIGAVTVTRDVSGHRRQERRTHRTLATFLAMAEAMAHPPLMEENQRGPAGQRTTSIIALHLLDLIRTVLDGRVAGISTLVPDTEEMQPVVVLGTTPEAEQQWWSDIPRSTLRDYVDAADLPRFRAGEIVIRDLAIMPLANGSDYGVRRVLCAPIHFGAQLIGILGIEHHDVMHAYTPDELTLVQATTKLAAVVLERERIQRAWESAHANELALQEANRRMDHFLGLASHEIRTPLTVCKGGVQLALRRIDRFIMRHQETQAPLEIAHFQALRNLLGQTDRQTDRLIRLVNDLLDVSRAQTGELEMRFARCDLVAIVRDVVAAQRLAVPQRELRLEVAETTAFIDADADRVGQVLMNYLTNAIKFAPEERPITIRCCVAAAHARVAVCDEGPGITATQQQRIWERFYRIDAIAVANGSQIGLGLGLYLARVLIERHHGHVGIESEPGTGAVFWFDLPLAKDTP